MRFVGIEAIKKREQSDFTIYTKDDKSLVTNVDYWANDQIITFLQNAFPSHIVIGEESQDKSYPKNAPFVWYVDPIDGTKQFTQGEDHFYILVGLAVNGIPEYGFFYKPTEDLFIHTDSSTSITIDMKGFNIDNPIINWQKPGSLVLKYVNADQKLFIDDHFEQKKHSYIQEMVSQMGPIFKESNGYLGFRRTYFWDICAPAAIMSKLGFQHAYFDIEGNPMVMNSGLVKCRSHFSLPSDAPIELITWFENEAKQLPQELA
jgi:fructose-1,6-bisphosphatase/inositol monophosphatase family enzyme